MGGRYTNLATRQRLRELANADLNRECNMYEFLCGDVKQRSATQEELEHYRTIAQRSKENNKYEELILRSR